MTAQAFRPAVAQPRVTDGPEAEVNAARTVRPAARASGLEAELILFPGNGLPGDGALFTRLPAVQGG